MKKARGDQKSQAQKPTSRFAWEWIFFLCTLALLGFVWLLDRDAGARAWSSFLALAGQILPILAIVYVALFAFNLMDAPVWLKRYVGAESGLRGWGVTLGAGALSLGPIYPWFIVLGELKAKGMRPALAAAFLYSRAVKPPLIPIMIHYFGAAFTLALMFFILVFAVLNGIVMGWLMSRPEKDTV